MKATGVVRRMDDLGRIVIPKEIRRMFRIKANDPLEFYTTEQGFFVKKYSPIGDIHWDKAHDIANTILGVPSALLDKDKRFMIGAVDFDLSPTEVDLECQVSPIKVDDITVAYLTTNFGTDIVKAVQILEKIIAED